MESPASSLFQRILDALPFDAALVKLIERVAILVLAGWYLRGLHLQGSQSRATQAALVEHVEALTAQITEQRLQMESLEREIDEMDNHRLLTLKLFCGSEEFRSSEVCREPMRSIFLP